jgi:hypothetical protein
MDASRGLGAFFDVHIVMPLPMHGRHFFSCRFTSPPHLSGRRVLLVDNVCTSGAPVGRDQGVEKADA